jgi:hypothetical protein
MATSHDVQVRVTPQWLGRLWRLMKLFKNANRTLRYVMQVCRVFKNWPTFLFKVGLSYFGLAHGDLVVAIRQGPKIICRNNTESWLPIFEIFVEDVYHRSECKLIAVRGGHRWSYRVLYIGHCFAFSEFGSRCVRAVKGDIRDSCSQ